MLRPLLRWIILTGCLSSYVISHASAGGNELVDFQLLDLSGHKHALSDYRDRWVIINFWATWCGPCIKEIPELVELQRKYRTTVQVLGINFEQSTTNNIRRYGNQLDINYPILRITDEPLVPFEPLKGLPTTFIVSPKGKIIHRHLGPMSYEQLKQWIDPASS